MGPLDPAGVAWAAKLLASWRAGDRDGAIEAGLMAFDIAGATLAPGDVVELTSAQAQLQAAWDTRTRYRLRCERLARRAAARAERRGVAAGTRASGRPPLPAAAAAALARAKARAQAPR